jgi:hypothetical protein
MPSITPYCLMIIEAVTSEDDCCQNVFTETDVAQLAALQREYRRLLASGWIEEDAKALSQEILTLPQWSGILSEEYARLEVEPDSFHSNSTEQPLAATIADTEAQVQKLIEELMKQSASSTSLRACQELTGTLEMLRHLKQSRDYFSYGSMGGQGSAAVEALETVKLRLLLDPGCGQEELMAKVDQLRKAERELLASRATLRDYEGVIESLREQLDVLLEERSRSNFSSPSSPRRDAPMFGRLRDCELDSSRQSERSFGLGE